MKCLMGFSNEEEMYILLLSLQYSNSRNAAVEFELRTGEYISPETIKNRWKENGMHANSNGTKEEIPEDLFREAFSYCEESYDGLLKILRVGDSKLIKLCNKFGVKPKGMPEGMYKTKNFKDELRPNREDKIYPARGVLNNRRRGRTYKKFPSS